MPSFAEEIGNFASGSFGGGVADAVSSVGASVADSAASGFSNSFSFSVPDSTFGSIGDIGSMFAQAGDWSSLTAKSIAQPFTEGFSVPVADVSDAFGFNGVADAGGDSFASKALDWLKSDAAQAAIGAGAVGFLKQRDAERQRKHEQNLIKLQKRHLGAYYVPEG